jgi:hypothetical protein
MYELEILALVLSGACGDAEPTRATLGGSAGVVAVEASKVVRSGQANSETAPASAAPFSSQHLRIRLAATKESHYGAAE